MYGTGRTGDKILSEIARTSECFRLARRLVEARQCSNHGGLCLWSRLCYRQKLLHGFDSWRLATAAPAPAELRPLNSSSSRRWLDV